MKNGGRLAAVDVVLVMAALVPAIHVFRYGKKSVDARDKPAHDGVNFHSAARRTSGAAARTSESTCSSNCTKFFWNIDTSLRAV